MCSHVDVVPTAFVNFIRYSNALPEIVLLLTVQFVHEPYVNQYRRVSLKRADNVSQFYWAIVKFGFAEQVCAPPTLAIALCSLARVSHRNSMCAVLC
jgi:K+ transporter